MSGRTYRYRELGPDGVATVDEERPVTVRLSRRGARRFLLELEAGGEKDRAALAALAQSRGWRWLPGAEGWAIEDDWDDPLTHSLVRAVLQDDGFAVVDEWDDEK